MKENTMQPYAKKQDLERGRYMLYQPKNMLTPWKQMTNLSSTKNNKITRTSNLKRIDTDLSTTNK